MSYYAGSTIPFEFIFNKNTVVIPASTYLYMSVKYPYYSTGKFLGYRSITGPVKGGNTTKLALNLAATETTAYWHNANTTTIAAVAFNTAGTFTVDSSKVKGWTATEQGYYKGSLILGAAGSSPVYAGLWELELFLQYATISEEFTSELAATSVADSANVTAGKILLNVSDKMPTAKTYISIPTSLIG